MTIKFDNHEDLCSQNCFYLASLFLTPICKVGQYTFRLIAPFEEFDCCESKINECALRALIFGVGAAYATCCILHPLAAFVPLASSALVSQVFRALGWAFQTNGVTLQKGSGPIKKFEGDTAKLKVLTYNIAAVPAGIQYKVAGVAPWEARIDQIIEKIEKEDPDVLVIQEAMDVAVEEALCQRLEKKYAYFIRRIGIGQYGGIAPGGVFMATKLAIHHVSSHPFENNPWTQCRAFGSLELLDQTGGNPICRVIGTHPAWKTEQREMRKEQWLQIQNHISFRNSACDILTLIAADSNVERSSEEGEEMGKWAEVLYIGKRATCWHALPMKWSDDGRFETHGKYRPRMIDNVYVVKKTGESSLSNESYVGSESHLVESYLDSTSGGDEKGWFDTRTAASDHHAVVAEVTIKITKR